MHLFLEPMDVWLFRDGRPFDAGSDHHAMSLFPPLPTVMQGALRSHHLVVQKVNLHNRLAIESMVGTSTGYPSGFQVRGPFVARRDPDGRIQRYFALPADTVPDGDSKAFTVLSPQELPDGVITSAATPKLLWYDGEPRKDSGGLWLDEAGLRHYLNDRQLVVESTVHTDMLFNRERRLGIRLDDARRITQEGALYETEFIRPAPGVGLAVIVDGLDGWPEQGYLRIGGEGHGARFEQVPAWEALPVQMPQPDADGLTRFKVYFATPAYFGAGWLPVNGNWSTWFEGDVKLVAAALTRPVVAGGYDLANDKHKPARRYIPAGSVYFFVGHGTIHYTGRGITETTDDNNDLARIGFGQVAIAHW